jgi:hypothetical protein
MALDAPVALKRSGGLVAVAAVAAVALVAAVVLVLTWSFLSSSL